jgi:hypothetical protein
MLPFAPDTGGLHQIRYSVTDHLKYILHQTYGCETPNHTTTPFSFTGDWGDLANWRVKSNYIGLETESSNQRTDSKNRANQGEVEVGLDLAGVKVWREP